MSETCLEGSTGRYLSYYFHRIGQDFQLLFFPMPPVGTGQVLIMHTYG